MFEIRRTTDAQFDKAFAILSVVGAWLEARGRRQRVSLTSRDTYHNWQAERRNYVVTANGEIAGVFTICHESLADWPEVNAGRPVHFLRALATHPDYRGRGVGAAGVGFAVNTIAPAPMYLDCVSDFLPDYYAGLGFQAVGRRNKTSPDGTFDITLMRHPGVT